MLTHFAGFAPDYVDYNEGWRLQRDVHAAVVAGSKPTTLILLEHQPVYTAGKRTEPAEMPKDGTPVVAVDRGGKITWHGPGQLVGYPIMRLSDPVDVVAYVRTLEQMMLTALASIGLKTATTVQGRSGVWFTDHNREDKIAAIGVRVEKGVTMHGFAINCTNEMTGFDGIIPCGIRDAGVTTVQRELGSAISPAQLAPHVVAAFEHHFAGVPA